MNVDYEEISSSSAASDAKLQEVLRALPRERAGADLRDSVMRRVTARSGEEGGAKVLRFRPEDKRRFRAWPGWVMAAAALLVFGLGIREWQHRREAFDSMQRIAELRGQFQELSRELDALRQEAAKGQQKVVFLGGNENVDLVLDLGRLAAAAQKDAPAQDPAALRKAREELARLYVKGEDSKLY